MNLTAVIFASHLNYGPRSYLIALFLVSSCPQPMAARQSCSNQGGKFTVVMIIVVIGEFLSTTHGPTSELFKPEGKVHYCDYYYCYR